MNRIVALSLVLLAGCTTLTPVQKQIKARNAAARPNLPVPPKGPIKVPTMVRAKAFMSGLSDAAPKVQSVSVGGITLQRWTPRRWVVSAPTGYRLQGAVFNSYSADGSIGTFWEWFNLPYVGTSGNSVTSNVPNVPAMNFRAIPTTMALTSKSLNTQVPKWFLEADKNIR